jgi:GDP-4-dehydro-6-deoxy-D-mannose reductase
MKALVTGASGFVGRYLVRALAEAGWRVLTLDRRGPADLVGDIRSVSLRGASVDVVFHLAGFANPTASRTHSQDAYEANAQGTGRLVREARAGRFVIASSCQVYPPSERPHTEEDPVSPGNPYSASKLCGEALALGSGKDVVVLRPFNHTGPGQGPQYVCPAVARQIAQAEAGRGERIIRMGNLAPARDFFDVRDMVRAYLVAAHAGRRGEIYNVSTGRPVSIARIVQMLAAQSRVPVRVSSTGGPRSVLTGDSSKFRAATGWRPEIPFSRTLSDLLAHERTLFPSSVSSAARAETGRRAGAATRPART